MNEFHFIKIDSLVGKWKIYLSTGAFKRLVRVKCWQIDRMGRTELSESTLESLHLGWGVDAEDVVHQLEYHS